MAQVKAVAEHDMSWLVKAARQMLQPVARLLVGKLSCNVAVSLLKEAYVDEARRQLLADNPKQRITKSVLALTTGLDTRQVTSLESDERRESYDSSDLCPEAAVLNSWFQEGTFKDRKTGKPAVLPIYGRGVTFQTLVSRNAGRNVTCPTVLNRLTESGNLEIVNDHHVRLISPYYVPVNHCEQTVLEVGSATMNRLGRAIAHNLETESADERWLHQDRWSSRIPADQVEPLRQKVRDLVETQIEKVEKIMEGAEAPIRTNAHQTVGIGWFYWEDGGKDS